MDFAITNDGDGYDLQLVDGDLVMLAEDSAEDVAQRVIYALSTWRGESPFGRTAGVPYLEGVFGLEPIPGVVALLRRVVEDVEGVDEIVGDPDWTLDGRTLSIALVIRVGARTVPVQLKVTP